MCNFFICDPPPLKTVSVVKYVMIIIMVHKFFSDPMHHHTFSSRTFHLRLYDYENWRDGIFRALIMGQEHTVLSL